MRKALNLRKFGDVMLSEELTVPVKTLSIGEEASIKFPLPSKMPMKISVLSEADKKTLMEQDKNYRPDTYIATKILDTESKEYKDYQDKIQRLSPILDAAKYIYWEKEIDTPEGKMPFYQMLEISNPKDWFEKCEALEEIGLGENHIEKIILKANALKGDSISMRLMKLQEITQIDYFTLISALDKYIEERQVGGDKIDEIMQHISSLSDPELSKLAINEKEE